MLVHQKQAMVALAKEPGCLTIAVKEEALKMLIIPFKTVIIKY